MKLNQLRYLVAVSEHGSIAKAARALFISQPSVSQAVKELEDELGFPVLIRERRGTTFTPRGLQVLDIAQTVMRELNKLDNLAGGSKEAATWTKFSLKAKCRSSSCMPRPCLRMKWYL